VVGKHVQFTHFLKGIKMVNDEKPRFTKQCTKCKEVKPMPEFKRKLSRAQTQARGYVGAFRLEIVSKLCKTCQPKPRKIEQLTDKEIMTKAGSGDLNFHIARSFIQERKDQRREKARRAVTTRWENVYREQWQEIVAAISSEIEPLHQQLKYAKRQKTEPNVAFFTEYKSVLTALREVVRIKAHVASTKADGFDWREQIDVDARDKLNDLWQQIPADSRARLRMPLLFNRAANTAVLTAQEKVDRRARAEKALEIRPRALTEQQIQDSTAELMRELGIR
jgi:hypothetical protein